MSKAQAIVVDSDEEPQPKKPKQDRSPLVLINGEVNTKRKQLTLKDMLSPRTNSSKFKVLSSPVSSVSPQEKGPVSKTGSETEVSTAEDALLTTPNRGVKRKSNFTCDLVKSQNMPEKQQKVPMNTSEKDNFTAENLKEASESIKSDTPVRKHTLNKSQKKETSKSDKSVSKTSIIKSSSVNTKDKDIKHAPEPASKTPQRKPTLESMLIRQTPKKPLMTPPSEENIAEKSESGDGTEETLTVKTVKRKFGDYKRSKSGESLMKATSSLKSEEKSIGQSTADKSPKNLETDINVEKEEDSESENMTDETNNSDSAIVETNVQSAKTNNSDSAIVETNVQSANTVKVSECDATEPSETNTEASLSDSKDEVKENKEPTNNGSVKRFHVDGEKPGPSGANGKSTITVKKTKPLSIKQKKIQDERDKKRREITEEKEKKRLEREKEKEIREEAKRLELAKKEEAKQKKEEERKQREEENKQKEEEKKQKDEDKKLKDSGKDAEKKRKIIEDAEEKRLRKEKKLKEQEKFKSFFVVKKPSVFAATPKIEAIEKKFRDFVITPSMAVAPITRTTPVTNDILSTEPTTWDDNSLHIRTVISEMTAKHKLSTDNLSDDLEIISISDPKQVQVKRKILHFHENHRPAYCGSWRKNSDVIHARRPFVQDKTLLEYDYDSDDDWEEEGEGEDITSEKEDDKEEEKEKDEDDDEDDGFFVPHGYLSDDEGDEDCNDVTGEAKKKRIERRKTQFEEEQKSKESGTLTAKVVGPVWQTESSPSAQYLGEFQAVWSTETSEPLDPFTRTQPVAQMSESASKKYIQELPVAGYGMLIKFLHGSPIGMSRAVETFQETWHSEETRGKVSKRQLTQLIPTLLKKCMRPGNFMKLCWYATDEVLEKYGLGDLIGLHCEAPPEPHFPPPITAVKTKSLLKFTKTSSAEQDLALLKHQMALQQAQQKQQQALQQALIQAVRQQEAQKAEFLQKAQLNTLKNFLASNTVKRVPLIPVNNNVSNGVSNHNTIHSNVVSIHSNSGRPSNSPDVIKSASTSQSNPGAPRRISLVPVVIKESYAAPINIDDDSK